MKRLIKPLLYAAAVLLMSVSCKKEQTPDPPYEGFCKDGSCCTGPATVLKFSKKIENARADLSNLGGGINYGFVIENIGSVPVCDLCMDKVKDLEPTFFGDRRPISHAYRVWGLVFTCTSCTSIGPYPPQQFYVERVEKVK